MKTMTCRLLIVLLLIGAGAAWADTATDKTGHRCFHRVIIPSWDQAGYFASVGAASDGRFHIVHRENGMLVHTERQPTYAWLSTDLFAADVDDISVEVGLDNTPTMVYVDAPTGYVKWLELGNPGVVETLNPAGPAADGAHIVQQSSNLFGVIFHSPVDDGLHYVERLGGIWGAPVRLADANGLGGLTFDGFGQPWVVYAQGSELKYAFRNGGGWTHGLIRSGQPGLGSRPAICRDNAGVMQVAWVRTVPDVQVMCTYLSGPTWIDEVVGDLGNAIDPELTIFDEPWGDDITIAYTRDGDGRYQIYNRFSAAVWDSRLRGYGSVAEGAAARHPQVGPVIVYREANGMRVETQEFPPTLTASFSPNPTVGGEPTTLNYSVNCADRIEVDSEFLVGGTLASGEYTTEFAPGWHAVTAMNGFMEATENLFLSTVPFGEVSLVATPSTVAIGNPVTLTWNVVGADTVRISPFVFAGNQSSGSTFTYPTADTTYTLWAENTGYGTTGTSVQVDVELFTNFSFTATGGTLVRGETAQLQWTATGADTVRIEPGGLQFVGPTGQLGIAPQDTTVYTMTAVNAGYGEQSAQVTVPVIPLRITSLTANPSVAVDGEPVILTWNVAGTANVAIDGLGSQAQAGNTTVYPSVDTDYVLTAEWEGFAESDTVSVQVVPFLELTPSFAPDSIERTPPPIVVGQSFDVWVHWTGPGRQFNGVEFALELPPSGIIATSSQLLVSNATNFGNLTEWEIYGDCVSSSTNTPVARITLLPLDTGALAGTWLRIGPLPGGAVPDDPGFINCSGGVASLVAGTALPLDPSAVAVPLPGAGRTAILGIHPNPFNPQARIRVELSGKGSAQAGVYDLAGRLVRRLDLGHAGAGEKVLTWDGRDDTGRDAPSGIYLVRLTEAGQVVTGRATLVR